MFTPNILSFNFLTASFFEIQKPHMLHKYIHIYFINKFTKIHFTYTFLCHQSVYVFNGINVCYTKHTHTRLYVIEYLIANHQENYAT